MPYDPNGWESPCILYTPCDGGCEMCDPLLQSDQWDDHDPRSYLSSEQLALLHSEPRYGSPAYIARCYSQGTEIPIQA